MLEETEHSRTRARSQLEPVRAADGRTASHFRARKSLLSLATTSPDLPPSSFFQAESGLSGQPGLVGLRISQPIDQAARNTSEEIPVPVSPKIRRVLVSGDALARYPTSAARHTSC